jgi:hypothetical protein
MFTIAGIMKLVQSTEKLSDRLPWVNEFSVTTVRIIGLSEFLGAIGLGMFINTENF